MTQAIAIDVPRARLDYSVPEHDYHAGSEVSFSTLKTALKSTRHYKDAVDNRTDDSPAMRMGRLVHVATLQPDRLPELYATWDGDRRGNKWTLFQAVNEAAGRECVKVAEYEFACKIRDAVRGHAAAMKYIEHARPEVSCYWQDEGLDLRGRFDGVTSDDAGPVLFDLKSTKEAGPQSFEFGREASARFYAMQSAMYQRGYELAAGVLPRFVIIAVENHRPFDVVVFNVPEEILEVGRAQYVEACERVRMARTFGVWHGQATHEVDLVFPRYAMPEEDTDLSESGLEF